MEKGTYVIVRARDAGVHAGEYVSHDGREVVLRNARRLWRWRCNEGFICLSGIATAGLSADYSRLGPVVSTHHVLDACEIIECTDAAATCIREMDPCQG